MQLRGISDDACQSVGNVFSQLLYRLFIPQR